MQALGHPVRLVSDPVYHDWCLTPFTNPVYHVAAGQTRFPYLFLTTKRLKTLFSRVFGWLQRAGSMKS